MKRTNYQLYDFLDINSDNRDSESMWRACRPTSITIENGDVMVTIPFQKQKSGNEISPDLDEPRRNYQLHLRAYGTKILRIAIGFEGECIPGFRNVTVS